MARHTFLHFLINSLPDEESYIVILLTCLFSISISFILCLKYISAPNDSQYSLMFFTTTAKTSVPICGLLEHNMSASAPNLTNVSSTSLILPVGSLITVLSLPSENVPAPPSPNCTLDSVSSSPLSQNVLTFFCLTSTLSPRSYITGFMPASESFKAANMPAGPNPIITGRSSSLICLLTSLPDTGNSYILFSTYITFGFFFKNFFKSMLFPFFDIFFTSTL